MPSESGNAPIALAAAKPSELLRQWQIQASTGRHFDVLDGLRGVAILIVVAYHTLYTNPAHGALARGAGYIIAAGWMGVPVFFVLSGFLISYPFFRGRNGDIRFWYPAGYAQRRLGKILPPFYLSILLFLGFYWWLYRDPAYFTSAWKWATGLANFTAIPVPFNLSYWSLIVEAHFYLLLPVLFWLTRGLSVRHTTLVLSFLLFAGPLVVRYLTWPPGLYTLPSYETDLYKEITLKLTRFPCQLDYFAWGIAFAGVFVLLGPVREQLRVLSVFGYLGLSLMAVSLLFWGYWGERFGIHAQPTRWSVEVGHFLPAAASLFMLFFTFDPDCRGARWLSARWLRFIGIVSYEWFLFHGPIVAWFHEHTGATHGSALAYFWRTIAPLLITFCFSIVVYRWFSLPILNRIRGRAASAR
ncbi:MAG: acyltransferase [Chthoniobacter sp.]